MRIDNPEHKALFTIPESSYGTAVATIKPLPAQRVITGHKQTDAYLWVLEVIQLNEPAHLEAAEVALSKLKIKPKDAQKHYSDYLMQNGAHVFQIAFGTMSMDDPMSYIERAKENIKKASQVRSVFGSYESALEDVEAEKLMFAGELGKIYEPMHFWTKKERLAECVQGKRCDEIDEKRKSAAKGFVNQLPEPRTLSDVVREYQYWSWLYTLRNCAAKELCNEYGDYERSYIYDREEYLEKLLVTIKPISRSEAVDVCKWMQASERMNDLGDITDNIILNLVGDCDNA